MKALLKIRDQPHYRREAFAAGLAAAGHEILDSTKVNRVDSDTLLVIWNRYWESHNSACAVEAAGGKVIVAENAYVGGPKDGGTNYALSLDYHNDSKSVLNSSAERFAALKTELKPWRQGGDHILVAPNRSFGIPGRLMPPEWPREVVRRLKGLTKREVRYREHPGNDAPKVPLANDLRGAHAVVIWTSSVGVRALCEGIPVICEAPFWICKEAAHRDWLDVNLADVHSDEDRAAAMNKLACAQFSLEEIASGFAFEYLLK